MPRTVDELKAEIAAADRMIASHRPPYGTPSPRPRRGIPGYEVGQASDQDILTAAAIWDATWGEPDHITRARRRKDLVERELATIEEKDARDAEVRAEHRARLEDRVKTAFLSNPAATLADWERNKRALIDAALMGEQPVDQIKREKLLSGAYERF